MQYLVKIALSIFTGAGGGIGRAVCSAFGNSGATIIAADKNLNAAEISVAELKGKKRVTIAILVNQ